MTSFFLVTFLVLVGNTVLARTQKPQGDGGQGGGAQGRDSQMGQQLSLTERLEHIIEMAHQASHDQWLDKKKQGLDRISESIKNHNPNDSGAIDAAIASIDKTLEKVKSLSGDEFLNQKVQLVQELTQAVRKWIGPLGQLEMGLGGGAQGRGSQTREQPSLWESLEHVTEMAHEASQNQWLNQKKQTLDRMSEGMKNYNPNDSGAIDAAIASINKTLEKTKSLSDADFDAQRSDLVSAIMHSVHIGIGQQGPGTFKENSKDGLKYVWIPPGTFQMGCSPGNSDCNSDEKPSHRITINKGFWIGQTDVTVGAYRKYAAASGASVPDGQKGDQHPVVNVNWEDATGYCRWAEDRLPTEAEWEYAARGGSTESRYGPIDEIAWYEKNSGEGWHEVGQKRPNGFGLFDMSGNVWQLVDDWYDANYYQNSPVQDPSGPSSGQYRILRGGYWYDLPSGLRVSIRYKLRPNDRYTHIHGFRCVGEVGSP